MNGRNSRFPFTPSQWQELEHQALIYKHMASGTSIPPDLLFTIRRTYLDAPPSSSSLLPHHHPQHFGWNYLQMGLGRRIDPEPGRCRRTDGKKWRCSKEACPDSKYCERHVHRGKNRSRKPVEVSKTTRSTNVSSSSSSSSSITKHIPAASLTTPYHHSLPPQRSCDGSYRQLPSRRAAGLSLEENSAPLFLDTGSCSHPNTDSRKRSRYVYGVKEDHADEHAFFAEPCGAMKGGFSASSMDDDSWQLTPLTMSSSSSSSNQRSGSCLSNDYFYSQLQSLSDHSKQDHQEPLHQKRTVHRFFDEWPHKGLDLDDKHSSTTTQLSISIPTSACDFPNLQFKNPPW